MANGFKQLFRGDTQLWVIYFLLIGISFVLVFSAASTLAYGGSMFDPIMRHAFFILVSFALVFLLSRASKWTFRALVLLYFLGIFLQMLVLFMGNTINEATRWISIFGIRFQPSELLKPGMVLMGAMILSGGENGWVSPKRYVTFIVAMFIPIILIGIDSTSTALLLSIYVLFFAWLCQAPTKMILTTGGIGMAIALLGVILVLSLPTSTLKEFGRLATVKTRVSSFLGIDHATGKKLTASEKDSLAYVITDENFQESHARIAIARSRGIGVGPGQSKERDILPQAYSDYIYAIVIEEFGLIGMVFIPLLFVWLYQRLSRIASRGKSFYHRYLLLGLGLLYVLQAFTNMAVATGVFPVTGQTLPLISRGGTSFIITGLAVGLMIGISRVIEENEQNIRPGAIAGDLDEAETEKNINTALPESEDNDTKYQACRMN